MLAKLGWEELCAGRECLNGDHVVWLNFCFLAGETGLSILVRILSGSHSEPPLIRQDSGRFLSRSLPLVETAGGFLSFLCGIEGNAQRPRPGREF